MRMVRGSLSIPMFDDPEGPVCDEGWSRLEPRHLLTVTNGEEPRWPTTVRVAATTSRLWVRFTCSAATIRATMLRYKDKVWQEDAVEVFFERPAQHCLFELQQSPIGVVRDLVIRDPGGQAERFDDTWVCQGLLSEAAQHFRHGKLYGWEAVFGIPWESLGGFPQQEACRIGLFRIERDPEEYSGLVAVPGKPPNFHDPRHLVPIRFLPGTGRLCYGGEEG